MVGFGAFVLLGTWIAALAVIRGDRRGEYSRAANTTDGLSKMLEEHISVTFAQIESSLFSLRRNWESGVGAEEMHSFLALFVASRPELFNLISVIDAAGNVVVTDQEGGAPTYSGDRPFFEHHRDHDDRTMRVGGPILGRVTGKWYLPVSVRLQDARGGFAGVLLASVNPGHFSMLFRKANLGDESLIYLADYEGVVYSGIAGGREQGLGIVIPKTLVREISRHPAGLTEVKPGLLDGVERIRSRMPISGRGMFVSVGIGLEEWMGPWRRRTGLLLAIQTVLTAGICVVVFRLRRAIATREAATQELNQFFSSALDLLCIADVKGNFLRLNKEWEHALGYSMEELGRLTVMDLVHPEDREATEAALSRLANQEEVLNFCNRYRRKDGTYRQIEWRSTARGKTIYAAARDITERLEGEEKLRLFMEAIDHASDAIGMSTPEGRHFYQNQAFARWFGAVEDGNARALYVDPAAAEEVFRAIIGGGSWTGEVEMRGADQSVRTVLLRAYAAKDDRGRVRVLVGMHTDMTERKRAEAEQARLQAQLMQAQKMESVGQLAGGVAHDFNNMLSVILGNVELALSAAPTDPASRVELVEIRKAAERSAALTQQLLAFARKQAVAPRVVDLNETVEGMLRMLQRLIGENIELSWQPGEDLWAVKMDPSQLDQILTNLCVNSRDAIADVGRIAIATGNVAVTADEAADQPDAAPGEYVRLEVSDNGRGMEPETLARIFEPFFTTKGMGKGTGLGLATIYGAVRQNGGFIRATSAPGKGTSVGIHLPRHVGACGAAPSEAGASEEVPRGWETVLLVEDEPSIRELTASMLQALGYDVLSAATPGEALRMAGERAGEIHLLLTDVIMPEMNGRELARRMETARPRMKDLYMSGYTADLIACHGVLDEGTHFLQKPFTMTQLAAMLRKTLDEGAEA